MKVLFVILSGGNGTRLRPATFFWQKTLFPVGMGKRIIDYALESSQGVDDIETKVVVLARYKSFQVTRYVKSRYPDVEVLLESMSLDTGGALLQHWSTVRKYSPHVVIVLNGDHFIQLPLSNILEQYCEGGKPTLLLIGKCSDERCHDYIDIRHDSEKMLHKFHDRKSRVAYTGNFLARFDVLDEYMQKLPMQSYNMTRDIVWEIYAKYGCDCYLLDGKWNDLGTWKRYLGFLVR